MIGPWPWNSPYFSIRFIFQWVGLESWDMRQSANLTNPGGKEPHAHLFYHRDHRRSCADSALYAARDNCRKSYSVRRQRGHLLLLPQPTHLPLRQLRGGHIRLLHCLLEAAAAGAIAPELAVADGTQR